MYATMSPIAAAMDITRRFDVNAVPSASCSDATRPKEDVQGERKKRSARGHERINTSDSQLSVAEVAEEGFGGLKKPQE